jgi:hypothetical protein
MSQQFLKGVNRREGERMKRLLVIAIIFAFAFVACGDDDDGDETASLTIKNESGYELTDVRWHNAVFANNPEDNSIKPGTSVTMDVRPGNGFVRFKPKFNPINVRTSELLIVEKDEQKEFIFLNTTVVVNEQNNSNIGTLGSFSGVAQIELRQGDTVIPQNGEYDFGAVRLDTNREVTFTIANSGGETLAFEIVDGNRINLTDRISDFFSIIMQPPAATISPGNTTTFTIRFDPQSFGSNFAATVRIKSSSHTYGEFAFRVRGDARVISNEARLSGVQFTTGTLIPEFHPDINTYDLRIDDGSTSVTVLPTSMVPWVSGIRVNGISQTLGMQSQNIPLSAGTVTIEITAEDGTTSAVYTITLKAVRTWQKMHGQAGRRYGVFNAMSNGAGGIYAGGYTGVSTAALFNFDGSGNLLNTFAFPALESSGIRGICSGINALSSVHADPNSGGYYIAKAASAVSSPSTRLIRLAYNGHEAFMYPLGIIRDGWHYFVAGAAEYAATTSINSYTDGIFVHRHHSDGRFEKGKFLPLSLSGFRQFGAWGMALLANGDVLLYGNAESIAGDCVAFAAAVNVSAANADSWSVRWIQTYEIANRNTTLRNHFVDRSSNIVLVGGVFLPTGGTGMLGASESGFVVRFPLSANTATAAKPSGWPKTIDTDGGNIASGLAVGDNSGYVFVGEALGPHGGDSDAWVVKTDLSADNKTWEHFSGGAGADVAGAIVEMSDGFIIIGNTLSPVIAGQTRKGVEDIYIFKINKDGTVD